MPDREHYARSLVMRRKTSTTSGAPVVATSVLGRRPRTRAGQPPVEQRRHGYGERQNNEDPSERHHRKAHQEGGRREAPGPSGQQLHARGGADHVRRQAERGRYGEEIPGPPPYRIRQQHATSRVAPDGEYGTHRNTARVKGGEPPRK